MFGKGISRRDFIKGAAASAVGIAALGLVEPAAAKAEGTPQEVTTTAEHPAG